VWLSLLVVRVTLAAVESHPSRAPWYSIVMAVTVVGFPVWQRRKARRAIELNSGPVVRSDE
jgi:hypothetical protein